MYIKVRVHPGAKKERVEVRSDTQFEIWVKEKAERNMANMRVRELVAREAGVSVGKTRLISGHQSPSKMFSIEK